MVRITEPGFHSLPAAWVLQIFAWPIGRLFFRIFFSLTIEGTGNLRTSAATSNGRPILFVGNHVSEFDAEIVAAGIMPWSALSPLFFVAKPVGGYRNKGLRGKLLYASWLLALFGGYPSISGSHDYATALAPHVQLLRKGRTMCIFPTGKTCPPGEPAVVRGGVGYLIEATNPIVVPVSITGIYKPTARSVFGRKHRVHLVYGEPVRDALQFIDSSLPIPQRYQNAAERVYALAHR